MNRKVVPVLLLLLILAVAAPVVAQISRHYDLNWHVLSGGGGPRSSSGYQIDDVLGQWSDGQTTSAHYQIDPGFWHAGRVDEGRRIYLPVVNSR